MRTRKITLPKINNSIYRIGSYGLVSFNHSRLTLLLETETDPWIALGQTVLSYTAYWLVLDVTWLNYHKITICYIILIY